MEFVNSQRIIQFFFFQKQKPNKKKKGEEGEEESKKRAKKCENQCVNQSRKQNLKLYNKERTLIIENFICALYTAVKNGNLLFANESKRAINKKYKKTFITSL